MKAKCPHCKNRWSVSRKYSGTTITCPSCREPVGLAPSAPIGAMMLTAVISTGLAVAVNYWMLSKETDVGKVNAAVTELQAEIDATTAQFDKLNEEFARIQSQIERLAIQPTTTSQFAGADRPSAIQIAAPRKKYDYDETAGADSETGDQTNGTTESKDAQDQPQKANQGLDNPESLLIFTGVIKQTLGPQLFVGSSTKKANQFTYSNFKYVPPFVLDESAVIEVAPGVVLSEDMAESNVTLYVVKDGKYEYKETIGTIKIPKLVNKYRETNLIDVPEQKLVEFQGDQPIVRRGARPLPKQKNRKVARQEMWKDIINRKRQQKKQLSK